MSGNDRHCVVCGRVADLDPRSVIGDCCAAARDHVVSMQIDQRNGQKLAICPCGWSHRAAPGRDGNIQRDEAVEAHWRAIVMECS